VVAAVALAPLLLARCGDQNACDYPPVEVGAGVTDVQAAADPCAGQSVNHIVAWFTRQGTRYPLRCGRRDPRGFGCLHIRYDEGGHGDPVNDATFRAEVADTLVQGIERLASGGTWRYSDQVPLPGAGQCSPTQFAPAALPLGVALALAGCCSTGLIARSAQP
jgi:hypothetical protein